MWPTEAAAAAAENARNVRRERGGGCFSKSTSISDMWMLFLPMMVSSHAVATSFIAANALLLHIVVVVVRRELLNEDSGSTTNPPVSFVCTNRVVMVVSST
jgi:hypothetical protein